MILVSIGFLALAAGVFGYQFLEGLTDAAIWLIRRRSTRGLRLAHYLSALGRAMEPADDDAQEGPAADLSDRRSPMTALLPFLPLMAGLAGAAAAWDPLLSPWLALLGYLIFRGLNSGRQQTTGRAAGEELLQLLNSFRSIWSVQESLFGALEEAAADLEFGVVRQAVRRVAARARTGMNLDDALTPLRDLPSPTARQVAYVLGQLPETDEGTGRRVLDELEERLRRSRRLRRRAETVLILTRLTLRALQVANAIAVVVALTMPLWADFFTASLSRRLTFIAATLMVVGGSAYFAGETERLEASL